MADPLFVSVDLEVTDASSLLHGRIMQIGAEAWAPPLGAGQARKHIFSAVLPVSNRAYTSQWVRQNLAELLGQCWDLRSRCYDWKENIAEFGSWVRTLAALRKTHAGEIPQIVFVGYCCDVDWTVLKYAFDKAEEEWPFHYEFIDISSLALGHWASLPWGFREADLEAFLEMEPLPAGRKHDASVDAVHQLTMFERIMMRREEQLMLEGTRRP